MLWTIIEGLDLPTLKAVALVNRELSHRARLRLFRTIRVGSGEEECYARSRFRDSTRFLTKTEYAHYVHDLRISVTVHLRTADRLPRILGASLQRFVTLETLHIRLPFRPELRTQAANVLSKFEFAPLLSTFITDLSGHEMAPFFTHHPRLHTLRTSSWPYDDPFSQLQYLPLPCLRRLYVNKPEDSNFIRGNPVTELSITSRDADAAPEIIRNMKQTTAAIERLTILVARDSGEHRLGPYITILKELPQLRFLSIRVSGWVSTAGPIPELLATLSQLGHLTQIEWVWWQVLTLDIKGILKKCGAACPSLSRIIIMWCWHSPPGIRQVYARVPGGEDDRFSLETEEAAEAHALVSSLLGVLFQMRSYLNCGFVPKSFGNVDPVFQLS